MKSGNYKIINGKVIKVSEIDDTPATASKIIDETDALVRELTEKQTVIDRNYAQIQHQRDAYEETRILTRQRLRQDSNNPLLGEVMEFTNAVIPEALIVYRPRRMAPSIGGQVHISCRRFYCKCESEEADITIQPDSLLGFHRVTFLKRIKDVKVGMRGRLLWALDGVMGWIDPANWIVIVDDKLTTADVTGTIIDKMEERGIVSGIRDGGGYVIVTVDLDIGGSVTISMLNDQAPKKGTRGTKSYNVDNEVIFIPDDARNA